jgi:hypothetical protein
LKDHNYTKKKKETNSETSFHQVHLCIFLSREILEKVDIRVITKLPNSEQSYKGKVKTHKYINRQNQSIKARQHTLTCMIRVACMTYADKLKRK